MEKEPKIQDLGKCDYLVIGSGAASLAFVDTLLTELPESNIVIVDRHQDPGGHWNDAYEYVQLHQPSLLYGVSSKQLEGNWMKLIFRQRMLPWKHRASREEILSYYRTIVYEWVEEGRVRYFPRCQYDFTKSMNHCYRQEKEDDIEDKGGLKNDDHSDRGDARLTQHEFSSLDGSIRYQVKVGMKLINGIVGECRVPSQCPPNFSVDKSVNIIAPNQLFDKYYSMQEQQKQHYVVLGAGKTGMDAIVYLQRTMKVDPAQITWVVPNDIWMLSRESKGAKPSSFFESLVRNEGDFDKACLELEQQGIFVRLSQDIKPTRFRFPVIGGDELCLLRQVQKTTIRKGRVTGLYKIDGEQVEMKFDSDDSKSSAVPFPKETVFVHCTSPGPFNGNSLNDLFSSDCEIKLSLLYAPPVPISMSCLATLEAARRKKTLDLEFGRKACELLRQQEKQENNNNNIKSNHRSTGNCNGDHFTDSDILRLLFRPLSLDAESDAVITATKETYRPLVNEALFFALLDPNPKIGYKWMQGNRLSFYSIPGFKGNAYEQIRRMAEHYEVLGFSEHDAAFLRLLAEKIHPLEGM